MSERFVLKQKMIGLCEAARCEEAIAVLEEMVRLEPRSYDLQYQLGVCYSGLCRKHSLIQPDIAVEHYRSALVLGKFPVDSLARADILSGLGNGLRLSTLLECGERLHGAIDCHRVAASIYLNRGAADRWAEEQYNLGNAWCEVCEAEYPAKWNRAIGHYRSALEFHTREKDPERFASTMQNLGTAYRELPTGDRGKNVRRAIACYHTALRVFTLAAHPEKNAALHNNLGNAYLTLPETNGDGCSRNVLRALRHFRAALRVRTRGEHPCDYGITRFNQGAAFLQLATCNSDRRACLERAAACYHEAEDCCESCGNSDYSEFARRRREAILSIVETIDTSRETPGADRSLPGRSAAGRTAPRHRLRGGS